MRIVSKRTESTGLSLGTILQKPILDLCMGAMTNSKWLEALLIPERPEPHYASTLKTPTIVRFRRRDPLGLRGALRVKECWPEASKIDVSNREISTYSKALTYKVWGKSED